MLRRVMPIFAKVSKRFLPLKVCEDQVLVTGGYNRYPEAVRYKLATVDDKKVLFLRVEAREPWLIKGASGKTRISMGLTGRTTLV